MAGVSFRIGHFELRILTPSCNFKTKNCRGRRVEGNRNYFHVRFQTEELHAEFATCKPTYY